MENADTRPSRSSDPTPTHQSNAAGQNGAAHESLPAAATSTQSGPSRYLRWNFLKAMDGYKSRDAELGIVVDAIKMTVKGGIGKLREKARGGGWKPLKWFGPP